LSVTPLRLSSAIVFAFAFFLTIQTASAQDVVLYASQAPVKVGNWSAVADSTAAGGFRLSSPDFGAAKVVTPSASPSGYVELYFYAFAGVPYHLWMRGKAQGDSPYNDSVHIQFSGSVTSSGSAIYRIGTNSSTEFNLEDCFACGIQGWGWQDNGWGTTGPPIYFQSSGIQTIRIQDREDGLSIDQIVLSPVAYYYNSPGALKNDSVILTAQGSAGGPTPTPTPTPTPKPECSDADLARDEQAVRSLVRSMIEADRPRINVDKNPDRPPVKVELTLIAFEAQIFFTKPCKDAAVTADYVWQIRGPQMAPVRGRRNLRCFKRFRFLWTCT
jgi:hypothetical protein